ncbi:MAG: hypothetical protein V4671_24925 [Armatimonadota bacterium]
MSALPTRSSRIVESPLAPEPTGMTDLQADAFRFLRAQGYASCITETVGAKGVVHSVAEAGIKLPAVKVANNLALHSAIAALRTGRYLLVGRQGTRVYYYRVNGQAAIDFAAWIAKRGYRSRDPHAKPLPSKNPIRRYPVVVLSQDDIAIDHAEEALHAAA